MKRGSFITFEGNEGVGKSTQVGLIADFLTENKIDFIRTREPGGTEIAEKIRQIILKKEHLEKMNDKAEMLLYAAARAQHFWTLINPNLHNGKMVICDRFTDSSLAYQAFARGLDKEKILEFSCYATGGVMPDLTICMLLNPIEAFKRKGGADVNDRIEQEKIDFHYRVYQGYKKLVKQFPKRIVPIDAGKSVEEVYAEIIKVMKERLPELKK